MRGTIMILTESNFPEYYNSTLIESKFPEFYDSDREQATSLNIITLTETKFPGYYNSEREQLP
jgi:hypothetical protein